MEYIPPPQRNPVSVESGHGDTKTSTNCMSSHAVEVAAPLPSGTVTTLIVGRMS